MSTTVRPPATDINDPVVDPGPERSFAYGPLAYLRRYGAVALVLVNLSVFLVLWQLFARSGAINPLFLPAPSDVFSEMWTQFGAEGVLRENILVSARTFAVGMGVAMIVGIPVGLLMGASRVVDAIISPYVWAMASLPRVALMPLLILILGFSETAKLTLVFLSAVFPIVINCMAGVKTVDQSLVRAGQVFGARKPDLYRKVIFPFTLPFIIAGINQGMTRGLVGLVIAEIFGGNSGLGYLTKRAAETFNSPLLYAVLLILVFFSLGFVQLIRWVEQRVAPWRSYGT